MPKANTLTSLQESLFNTLDDLDNPDLSKENIDRLCNVAKAKVNIGKVIVQTCKIQLEAIKISENLNVEVPYRMQIEHEG